MFCSSLALPSAPPSSAPPCTCAQLPLFLGLLSLEVVGLQEPLIFPLGIPTCWGERSCWEAATPSITKRISTT